MELDGIKKKSRKRGEDNSAFKSEEQIYIDVDSAPEVTDDAHKKTDQHNKSFPERKMEAFQGYLAGHKDQIHLIMYLVLAAGLVAIVIAA
ncbi:hypothetical protein EPR50_G00051310 [Perca flavescens]|uniref:Uncharacterized protein n=1 Tax=Perca flavescens TaxID=8167 RepID=A0A484DE32_PERFV|nr:hypothetical protein EPR50_G00051310 [Perca flavescens]